MSGRGSVYHISACGVGAGEQQFPWQPWETSTGIRCIQYCYGSRGLCVGGGEVGSWGCTSFVSTTISARSQSGQSRSPQNRNFCAQHMTEKRSVSVHGARKREGVENRAGGRVVSASVASAARWAGGDELHRLAFTAHEPVSSQAPVLHPKASNSAAKWQQIPRVGEGGRRNSSGATKGAQAYSTAEVEVGRAG